MKYAGNNLFFLIGFGFSFDFWFCFQWQPEIRSSRNWNFRVEKKRGSPHSSSVAGCIEELSVISTTIDQLSPKKKKRKNITHEIPGARWSFQTCNFKRIPPRARAFLSNNSLHSPPKNKNRRRYYTTTCNIRSWLRTIRIHNGKKKIWKTIGRDHVSGIDWFQYVRVKCIYTI